MKVLLVGANPSRHNKTEEAFIGSRSGKTLQLWLEYMEISDYTLLNASDRILKPKERLRIGDFKLERLLIASKKHDEIIALGGDAAKACDLLQLKFHLLPHPSGLNRQNNDKKLVKLKLDELKKVLWK